MELFEIIDRLKETHDKQDFDKAINILKYLIDLEIGSYNVPYDILFTSKEKFDNQTLKKFVSSDSLFIDLIKGNIVDLDSFNKVIDLVKRIKELELRIPGKYCNYEEIFQELLLYSLKTKLELDDTIFERYAELIPYMVLDSIIVLYDGENSYNIIKNYVEEFDRNDYFNFQYYPFLEGNDELFKILSDNHYRYKLQIMKILNYFQFDEKEYNHNRLLNRKENLNEIFDELIYELLDDNLFISKLIDINSLDYDSDKKSERYYFNYQLRIIILKKVDNIKEELTNEDYDEKKILSNVSKLTNYYLLNSLFNNDVLLIEINDIFEELKEKRAKYL